MNEASQIINHLGLVAHPEGGYYREVYRSPESMDQEALPRRYSGERSFSTSIYFMLVGDQKSHFHKVESDETWHHYLGGAVRLHILDPSGQYQEAVVGKDFGKGEHLQYTVRAGHWFAGELLDSSAFALVGCTVAPGFDFNDFELATRERIESINSVLAGERPDLILS